MKKIKVRDYTEQEKASAYLEGFIEGRNNTVAEIIRMHQKGSTLKQIFKFLKDFNKAMNENNSKRS